MIIAVSGKKILRLKIMPLSVFTPSAAMSSANARSQKLSGSFNGFRASSGNSEIDPIPVITLQCGPFFRQGRAQGQSAELAYMIVGCSLGDLRSQSTDKAANGASPLSGVKH
jgi:hypothetical protein